MENTTPKEVYFYYNPGQMLFMYLARKVRMLFYTGRNGFDFIVHPEDNHLYPFNTQNLDSHPWHTKLWFHPYEIKPIENAPNLDYFKPIDECLMSRVAVQAKSVTTNLEMLKSLLCIDDISISTDNLLEIIAEENPNAALFLKRFSRTKNKEGVTDTGFKIEKHIYPLADFCTDILTKENRINIKQKVKDFIINNNKYTVYFEVPYNYQHQEFKTMLEAQDYFLLTANRLNEVYPINTHIRVAINGGWSLEFNSHPTFKITIKDLKPEILIHNNY